MFEGIPCEDIQNIRKINVTLKRQITIQSIVRNFRSISSSMLTSCILNIENVLSDYGSLFHKPPFPTKLFRTVRAFDWFTGTAEAGTILNFLFEFIILKENLEKIYEY